jgi:hypothetical protein
MASQNPASVFASRRAKQFGALHDSGLPRRYAPRKEDGVCVRPYGSRPLTPPRHPCSAGIRRCDERGFRRCKPAITVRHCEPESLSNDGYGRVRW